VKIYGGGVSEVGYLDELSRLIGQYSYINVSRSHSKHGSSSSRQENKDEIFSPDGAAPVPGHPARLRRPGHDDRNDPLDERASCAEGQGLSCHQGTRSS
jgi:hypothetical protein